MTDWSQIVRQHGPVVWRTAYRLLSHEADAADCFQSAFVSAWEVSQREPIGNWPALLKRLATARALERLRERHRRASRLVRLPECPSVDEKAVGPEQVAQHAELIEHLRDALTGLEPRQAQVFCLACLEGLSYQQIAGQLKLTVNHVGVLLNRARSNLRERLRGHGPAAAAERFKREIQP